MPFSDISGVRGVQKGGRISTFWRWTLDWRRHTYSVPLDSMADALSASDIHPPHTLPDAGLISGISLLDTQCLSTLRPTHLNHNIYHIRRPFAALNPYLCCRALHPSLTSTPAFGATTKAKHQDPAVGAFAAARIENPTWPAHATMVKMNQLRKWSPWKQSQSASKPSRHQERTPKKE